MDNSVQTVIVEPSSSKPAAKKSEEFHFILPLDYQIEPALLLDYERELGITSIKGIIDFYNQYFDDKDNWEEIGKSQISHIWNYKKGTPFCKDQPFVMGKHALKLPKLRKEAKGTSDLFCILRAMLD